MGKCKIFINTQPVIIINDEYYDVEVFIEGEKLSKGIAYVKGDYVYIYRGKMKNKESKLSPGIYKQGDKYVFVKPTGKDKDKYSVDNINELSRESIFDIIESHKEEFVQPEDVEVINNNSEIYTPTIKESDDFLKFVVKELIIRKHINLRNYKGRFSNEYALNNMKSGLNKSTKMTVPNFTKWMEILGADWELRVWDNGTDNVNPLENEIVVSSKDF